MGPYNSDNFSPDDETPSTSPATYIAFKDLEYETLPGRNQRVSGYVMVRIVYHTYRPDDFEKFYAICDQIHEALQGLRGPDFGPLIRVQGEQDTNFKYGLQSFDFYYQFQALDLITDDKIPYILNAIEVCVPIDNNVTLLLPTDFFL